MIIRSRHRREDNFIRPSPGRGIGRRVVSHGDDSAGERACDSHEILRLGPCAGGTPICGEICNAGKMNPHPQGVIMREIQELSPARRTNGRRQVGPP